MISDITPRTTQNCNGSLKAFSFTFPIINSSDLTVFLIEVATGTMTTLVETTDYTVADPNGVMSSRANYSSGGTVTTTAASAYTSAYTITIERSVPYTQAIDFTEGMPSLYQQFEQGLDKETMLIQQVKRLVERSPHCPIEDPDTVDMELPAAADRANMVLGFDADGDAVAVTPAATGATGPQGVQGIQGATGAGVPTGGAANLKVFMNAAGSAAEWASGVYIGTITRDMTAAGAPTDVAYTGVGFKGSCLIVSGTLDGGAIAGIFGVDNGSTRWKHYRYTDGYFYRDTNGCIVSGTSAGNTQTAFVKSFDADGFTLTWTKTGSPTGTGIFGIQVLR